MMTSEIRQFSGSEDQSTELMAALRVAREDGIQPPPETIRRLNIPRRMLLDALSEHFKCPYIEYDERMPIPPGLLDGLISEVLSRRPWFPVIRDVDTVVIATPDPSAPGLTDEVSQNIKTPKVVFWVALQEDILWFIQDHLHADPGKLIGTERTGLAFWRNTMALWRTRLACYRNDLAKARTDLAFLRWGLGTIAVADTLMRTRGNGSGSTLLWIMTAAGALVSIFGLTGYVKIRRSRISLPGHHTLVEVTAATLRFLEDYHFIDGVSPPSPAKQTMLGRLGDFLASHCTILYPSPPSRERTHLARERNVLAAQRTVAACYRTIYARARTGLAFIRTGGAFAGLGLGLLGYFRMSTLTVIDSFLIFAGLLLMVDGIMWYLPVRKEQAEVPRCPVPLD